MQVPLQKAKVLESSFVQKDLKLQILIPPGQQVMMGGHKNMKPEQKVFLQTRLRNLKRKYAKIIQHAEFAEEAISLKADIDQIEKELKLM